MDLREYLIKYDVKKKSFAKKCGVGCCTISNIIAGKKRASVPLALRMEYVSDDKIDGRKIVASWNVQKLIDAKSFVGV